MGDVFVDALRRLDEIADLVEVDPEVLLRLQRPRPQGGVVCDPKTRSPLTTWVQCRPEALSVDLRRAAYAHALTRLGAAVAAQGTHAWFRDGSPRSGG